MNKGLKWPGRMGFRKRVRWIVVLSCLLPFMLTAPVGAWPIIKVSPPSNLTIDNVACNSVTLNWKDNSYNEEGFQVEISTDNMKFESLATVPDDTESYLCAGLSQHTRYWFRVLALGNNDILVNSDYSNVVNATTLTIPEIQINLKPPSDLVAAGASKSSIRLYWKDNTADESGYCVERKINNGAFVVITQVSANFVAYTDLDVRDGFVYTYRVMAKGDGFRTRDSGYSNEAAASVKPGSSSILKPPTNLTAVADSYSQISLAWTDNAANESGYCIERAAENGPFNLITTLLADNTAYVDTGLQENTRYTYRVRAIDANGQSEYSNRASAITGQKDVTVPAVLKFYIGSKDYYINDQLNWMDTTPVIADGRTLLPISYVATPLGIAVYWDDSERKVTLNRKGTVIEMWIDQSVARINGVDTYIDPGNLEVAPRVYENRTVLPLSFVATNFDCAVEWFTNLQEVRVTYPVPENKRTQL